LALEATNKFNQIYGIDVSPSQIKQSTKNAAQKLGNINNIHSSLCNINEKIDFPDSMFDTGTTVAILEYTFDPYSVVIEIHMILKKTTSL
jgi:2-polyprenyl-3-methyl-5-hydroxy-6-metoxy-1,4-benzoquinol methylase